MPIRPKSACHEQWSEFVERPGGRHCGSCDVTVVDLTRLTRRNAERLIERAGGHMCARMRIDADGEPVFLPETERASRWLGAATIGLLAAACEPAAAVEIAPTDATVSAVGDSGAASMLEPASASNFGGSLMGIERTPMRPLGDTPVSAPQAETGAAPIAVLETSEVVPTPEQLLLTDAKEARERGRRRRTASIASPGTRVHPLPPFGSPHPGNVSPPASHLYLGGISYVP